MLEIIDLRVHYNKVEAVKGISLRLEHSDFICLIGANGAGKTTTMRTISGLKKPTTGKINFLGEHIDGLPPERIARRGLILVPEGRRIFPFITVQENLMVGAYLINDKKAKTRRLEQIYERFPRLAERKNQQGGTLSGGEQQMLAFGRALMANPKLLMLDEPTLGLAPIMVEECMEFAVDTNKDGIPIILVEQNARLALSVSQRAYVMETGSITLEGDSHELVESEHVKKAYLGL